MGGLEKPHVPKMVTAMVIVMMVMAGGTQAQEVSSGPRLRVASITRHYQGDIFTLHDDGASECHGGGGRKAVGPGEGRHCQCPAERPTFRDDLSDCVSTLTECPLANFVSSSGSEKIPYVYMPLKQQLVHPTAEVALLGLEHGGSPLVSPVCVVTKGSLLTYGGWKNMANTSTFEPPFRLYRDAGRTYVQWVGEEAARTSAEGRLVLVKLICRDAAQPNTPVFGPCLAFRVAGSPGAAEAALSAPVQGGGDRGLSYGEGIIIGLVVTCLAIIYVVGMTIYIKVKRRRKRERVMAKLAEEGMCTSKSRGGRSKRGGRPPSKPSSLVSSDSGLDHEDIEDLSLASRTRRANREKKHISFTTAVVHSAVEGGREVAIASHDPADGLERAHRSPLAVVETVGEAGPCNSGAHAIAVLSPDEGQEGASSADCHDFQTKKKLYFNPAYFEPEMLQSPPPAALEFLTRIREMISVAKSKMRTKTYQPSLFDIPEEDSDGNSRPLSRLTNRSSSVTLAMEESEDGGCVDASDGASIQSDSLERQKESDSRSSTLRRLARRVNSHGESFVSEIIKTLDLKPRLPRTDGVCASSSSYVHQKPKAPMPPPPKPVNSRCDPSVEVEDEFPELIKPSMLKSVLRDGRRLTDLNNTFENFRQEMMATFHKMKKVGEAISPKSSLTRSKNKSKMSPLNPEGKSESESGDGKVQKWLQTLENRGSYTRMSANKNVVFDSRTAIVQNHATAAAPSPPPPPLPEKNSRPPTPPRRNRTPAYRSISFSEAKDHSSFASSRDDSKKNARGCVQSAQGKTQVTRSLSWQNEHRHYDSNPRRSRQQVPLVPEESLNTSFGSEDDSLNDLLSEAESKVPKMTPSDSESVYSDTKSRSKDSQDSGRDEVDANPKTLSRQLPREEEMTARNEVYNKRTGAKTMSRLARNGETPYERVVEEKDTDEYDTEHTYEELQFSDGSKQRQKRKAPKKPKDKKSSEGSEDSQSKRTSERDESPYEIYSNPDSLVSEVTIQKYSSPIYSGCTVTIPVVDNVDPRAVEFQGGYDQDTLERRGERVDRNGSIIRDSLERPKVKKKNANSHEDATDEFRLQRRMTFPNETFRNTHKSLLHIYESRNINRRLTDTRTESPERSYSPVGFSSPPSPTRMSSFYLANISDNMNNLSNLSADNDMQKKYRTFKDYKKMRFQRGSSASDTVSSPLPVTGTSINFNFRSSSPSNKEQRELRPPLPPKQTRPSETAADTSSPVLPPKTRNLPPPLPLKTTRKPTDSSDSDNERPKLPEKSRKKPPKSLQLSRSSSGSSIPELTEEEARSILHGLLAHEAPSPDAGSRLSTLHEEDVEGNFLGARNTAASSDSGASVPCLDAFSSGSIDTLASWSPPSPKGNVPDEEDRTLGKRVETSLDRQFRRDAEEPGSPEGDARVSGEFILSTIGRSPSLHRQSSLGREPSKGFLAKLRDMADAEGDGEAISKGMEIALAVKAKSDLEKHFKEKSGADSIKRTWRRIIEKVDDSKEEKDKASIMELQQYMAGLERKDKETKLKQEDSGYHSTDSSESANSGNSHTSLTSTALSTASNGAPPAAQDLPSKHLTRTSFYTRSSLSRPHHIQRSVSMQQLVSPSTPESPSSSGFGSFQRASLRASMSRRYHEAPQLSGGLSLYINKRFTSAEDIHGNIHL